MTTTKNINDLRNKIRIILRMVSNDALLGKRISSGNSTVLIFVIILAFLFGLFFNSTIYSIDLLEITPILYISTIVIASSVRLSSTLVYEQEHGIIDLFRICPFSKDLLFVTKIISNLIFLFIVNIVYFAALALFLNLQVDYLMLNCFLVISFILVPFSIIGTLVSALMVSSKRNDILFTSILIPLEMPILIGTVSIMSGISRVTLFDITLLWQMLLYTILIFVIGAYIFEKVLDSYS